eukprot:19755-Eustigmatos_ZCMA.PRE.1
MTGRRRSERGVTVCSQTTWRRAHTRTYVHKDPHHAPRRMMVGPMQGRATRAMAVSLRVM